MAPARESLGARWAGTGMAELFAVNPVGPALIAKHTLPLLRRDGRAVFAALSARVGSIADNRLGGWHAYSASEAALNMLVQEPRAQNWRARTTQAIAVTLHPGTVDTGPSAPFQRVRRRSCPPAHSAARAACVLHGLTPAQSGGLFCVGWSAGFIRRRPWELPG